MAGLGSFNPAAATKNLQNLAQKTGKGPLAKAPSAAPPKLPSLKGLTGSSGPKAQPQAQPKQVFSPKLQETFRPLGKQVGAPSKLGNKATQERGAHTGGHSGFNLATALNWIPSLVANPTQAVSSLIAHNAAEHAVGTGKAVANDPVGVVKHTVSSVVPAANALAMMGVRGVEESALGLAKFAGAKVPGGTGDPFRTVGEFGKQAVSSTLHTIKEKEPEVQKEVEKEGALNQLATYVPVGGGVAGIAGRFLKGAVKASKFGEGAAAANAASRDATIVAHQAPKMHEFIEQGKPVPSGPKLSLRDKVRAFVGESAGTTRPPLHSGGGTREGVKVARGSTVTPQDRSANLFHSMGQTALDNTRRGFQARRLQRVVRDVEEFHKSNPETKPGTVSTRYGAMLDNITHAGEVSPLLQKGGFRFPGSYFFGARKAQRIGASYPKAELIAAQKNAGTYVHELSQPTRDALTPSQQKLLVLAKEGHLNLTDPQLALTHLKEIQRQANAGSENGSLIPMSHRMAGSDVGRTVGSVIKEAEKHGIESIVTPEFEHLVRSAPDERLTAPHDRLLNAPQTRDLIPMRRQGPALQTVEQEALHGIENARKSGETPAAHDTATVHGVKRVHEKWEAGHQARLAALEAKDPATAKALHAEADSHLGEAHNLANELIARTGRPTDLAYVKHTPIRGREGRLHVVGRSLPQALERWRGKLQTKGYRSLDPLLVEDAMHANLNNSLRVQHIADFHNREAVLPQDNLTRAEAQRAMEERHLDPEHYEVANIVGRTIPGMADRFTGGSDMVHMDLSPQEQAKTMDELLQSARSIHGNDLTKGANIYSKDALRELQGSLASPNLYTRMYGKGKGLFSSAMLGTSPAWATTMSLGAYPSQAVLGGVAPWHAFGVSKLGRYYRGWSDASQRRFDTVVGADNPYGLSSHSGPTEKLGEMRLPGKTGDKVQNLVDGMKVMRQSPIGKVLSRANLPADVLAAERIPRRYARIAVGLKHSKAVALESMLTEAKGLHASHIKFEQALLKLGRVGKMPSHEYMDQILKQVPLAEEIAKRSEKMLGDWHHMTVWERNVAGKIPLFYPWVRWSAKLGGSILPTHHPLATGFAAQLGVMSREELRHLLGTEAPIGKAPIGRDQGSKEPDEREYMWAGAPQVDPLLNAVSSLLPDAPSKILGVLPPWIAGLIEQAVNRNSFTDRPLKVSQPYERKRRGESKEELRPKFFPTYLNQNAEAFAPYRGAQKLAAGGRSQSAESILGSAPMHYSPRFENKLASEKEEQPKESTYGNVAKYALPLLPHKEPGIMKFSLEQKKQKERKEQKQETSVSGGW